MGRRIVGAQRKYSLRRDDMACGWCYYSGYGECWVRNLQEDVSFIDLGAKVHQGFLVKGGL